MADRLPLSALSDSELEQRLIDLGPRLYPTSPDLATQVRHWLDTEPARNSLTPTPLPVRWERDIRLPHRERSPFSPRMGRRVGDEGSSIDVQSIEADRVAAKDV